MSAITAKASRKMKKYAVLTREPRCFLGSFDFSWEQRKFSDITFPAGEKNKDNLPLESYSITNEHGFVPQDEKFENGGTMREADKRMYYIVSPNSFAYNPARINVGSIGYQNIGKNVIVSSLYEVFKTSEDVDDRLLWHWFKSPDFQKLIMQLQEGGVRLYFYYDKLCMGEVSLPSLEEQRKIGKLFDTLDNLITLHQRKCANLCSPSQVVFSLLFVTSTFSWEQRKLGDISEIKTGPFGSTLHADDYVSDGTPIITTEHFKTGALPRSKNGLPQVSDSDYKRLTAYTLDDGDIVFSRVGSVDINALITPFQSNWLFSGRVLRVRPQTDISSKFLHTRLETESIKTDIRTRAVGQTMPSINTEILKITPLVLPSSAAEQEQIGSYFAALDNLITLHQRECISFTGRADRLILTANKKRTTSSWEQRKVGDLLIERNQQAPMSDEYPLMAFIANEGVAPKGERYDRSALVTDTVNKLYKKTEKGDFIYSSNNLETGSIGLNKYGKACISPVYSIFEPTGIADSDFLGRRLVRKDFINAMVKWRQGVIYGQWRIHESDFLKIEITVPSVEEQRKIGTYLDQLDHLITLHQRKPFLMKWRTSDANRNQTNRLVL